jgi:hypothetical protein
MAKERGMSDDEFAQGRMRAAHRAEAMERLYNDPLNPHSLADIGQVYGVSRERVRQILDHYAVERRDHGGTKSAKYQARQALTGGPVDVD